MFKHLLFVSVLSIFFSNSLCVEIVQFDAGLSLSYDLENLSPRSQEKLRIHKAMVAAATQKKEYDRLVAVRGPSIAGLLSFGVQELSEKKAGYILGLVADESAEGVKEALVEQAVAKLREKGCHNITVPLDHTHPDALSACKFYGKLGFRLFLTSGMCLFRLQLKDN